MRIVTTLIVLMLTCVGIHAQEGKESRRIYVLHSGMHIVFAPKDKDEAARTLRAEFVKRGVRERDIVTVPCPFPTAGFDDPFPRAGLLLYLGSANPKSRVAHDAYLRLHQLLQANQATSEDRIVWIGHSAGGQIGMTMAHLAHHLQKYPELAKKARSYRFESVITLGSAVGANTVPADVNLRHYYSPADTMISTLSKHGDIVSASVGIPFRFAPYHDLHGRAKVRVFRGIEHMEWYSEPRVLDRILQEPAERTGPTWQTMPVDLGRGVGLAQLLARSLEATWSISVEEP